MFLFAIYRGGKLRLNGFLSCSRGYTFLSCPTDTAVDSPSSPPPREQLDESRQAAVWVGEFGTVAWQQRTSTKLGGVGNS